MIYDILIYSIVYIDILIYIYIYIVYLHICTSYSPVVEANVFLVKIINVKSPVKDNKT